MERYAYFVYDRIERKPLACGNNRRKCGIMATRLAQAHKGEQLRVWCGGLCLPRFCVLTTENNPDVDVSGLVIA